MKIKRLKMTDFGPYQNKIIEISDGINLIIQAGTDSEGTVRDFIESMFFGPSDQIYWRYLDGKEKADGEMLLVTDDGRTIKVERNLLNGRVDVFNENGDDITYQYRTPNGEVQLLAPDSTLSVAAPLNSEELGGLQEELNQLMDSPELIMLSRKQDALSKEIENKGAQNARIRENQQKIEQLEAKRREIEEKIEQNRQGRELELDTLKKNNEEIREELEKLETENEDRSEERSSRSRLLERNEKGATERISEITAKLNSLYEEQDRFSERLEILKMHFTLNKDELVADEKKLNYALERESSMTSGERTRMMQVLAMKNWVVWVLLILGLAIDVVTIINPGSLLNYAATVILIFIGTFLALLAIFFIYLRTSHSGEDDVDSGFEPISAVEAVLQKYRKESVDDFEDFYDKAMKLFGQMSDLESDLQDIDAEIEDARSELDRYSSDRAAFRDDLQDEMQSGQVEEDYLKRRERIDYLEGMFDHNEKRIAELETNEDLKNPIVVTTPDGTQLRADAFENYIRARIKKLQLQNRQITDESTDTDLKTLQKEYDQTCRKIDQIETKIEDLRMKIEAASGGHLEEDLTFDEKITLFGVGLPKNLRAGADVPLILDDPFGDYAPEEKAQMIHLFREMAKDRQTLLFTQSGQLKKIFDTMKWPYNGILVTDH